jgi:hypothetical protein
MGLDQYLYANKNIGSAEWRGDEEREQFAQIVSTMNAHDMVEGEDIPSMNLAVKVGCWRKANHIHGWFVRNVQDGEDECREYDVTRGKLQELLTLCQTVKQDPSKAEKILSPTSGFFFGSDEIDEWYWHDIDYTIELLSRVLTTVSEDWYITYQASW